MSYSNNRITAPVNQHDVQQALGINSPHWKVLCTSNNINKWARYKPVRSLSKITRPITFAERKAVNFGLDVPYCNTYPSTGWVADVMNKMVFDIIDRAYVGWNYLKPGGNNEPYRITDYVRNPHETTPSSAGDPTPVNLQGYNHGAHFPFSAFLDMIGFTEKTDSDGVYYEINYNVTQVLKITFFNSGGDDLHLQDFITIEDFGNNRAWRPVLQVFNGYINLTSSNPDDRLPWYERDNLGTYDMEAAGGDITTNPSDTWSVTIDLSDSKFTSFINKNVFFHMCVGVGCVNPDFSSWKNGAQGEENALFVIPYTENQINNSEYPFYFRFKVVRDAARTLEIIQLQYNQQNHGWTIAGGTAPYFEIYSNAYQLARLTFTLTEIAGQPLDFVGENGSQSATNTQLKIRMIERITGQMGQAYKYLTPCSDSWAVQDYVTIPGNNTGDIVQLYAHFYIGNGDPVIPIGQYAEYQIEISTDGGTSWSNIGSMSIHMNRYV